MVLRTTTSCKHKHTKKSFICLYDDVRRQMSTNPPKTERHITADVIAQTACQKKSTNYMINDYLCFPLRSPLIHPPFPLSLPSSLLLQSTTNIYLPLFTRGLCSPGYQPPRSFSAESRWFPGCILPHFLPVNGAKHTSHTLCSVHYTQPGLFSNIKSSVLC